MNARPILFSGPMIRALLEGKKTQTRRVVKPHFGKKYPILNLKEHGQAKWNYSGRFNDPMSWGYPHAEDGEDMALGFWPELCPYGKTGDLLWVRESCWWFKDEHDPVLGYSPPTPTIEDVEFRADAEKSGRIWRSSIHMPRWASRLTLRITDVRVQRLQDISGDDAKAEGIPDVRDLTLGCGKAHRDSIHRSAYLIIWESINGPDSWADDPWVWAISFEVIKANVDAVLAQKVAA